MSLVVPLTLLITGVSLWLAARRFVVDVAQVGATRAPLAAAAK